jgi:glycine/D-amino acid oxidase-like deaminating enzyme
MFAMIGPRPAPTDSWWLRHLPSDAMPAAVAVPDSADTVIVGAGMTGCATAYWLQKLFQKGGADVVVLDARGCAGGATGRNGGHLWSNPASTFEQATVAELLSFIEEANVDCDLTRDGATALDRREPEVDVTYNDGEKDPENYEDEDWGDKFVEWSTAECEARLQTDAVRWHARIEMLSARPFPPSHHTFSRALPLNLSLDPSATSPTAV